MAQIKRDIIILGEITKEPQGAGKCEDKEGSIMMNGQAEGKREDERLGEKLDGERRYRTVGQNSQKYILKYWATRSSSRFFAHTAHTFACSGLLASLAPSAALAHFAHSLARETVND